VDVHGVGELILDSKHWIQGVHSALEDDGDLAPTQGLELISVHLEEVLCLVVVSATAIADGARGDDGRGPEKPASAIRKCRLARARLSGEADYLALADVEVNVVNGSNITGLCSVRNREVLDLKDRLVRCGV
jgi:hypothetical protein